MRVELSPGVILEIFPPVRSSRRLWVARARLLQPARPDAAAIQFSGIGATAGLAIASAHNLGKEKAASL